MQSIQSYLPPTIELPKTTNVVFTPNKNYQATLSISVGNVENLLITFGKYYAIQLIRVLDALKTLNEDAIYPITSILEPYMEPIPELNFSFPPKSSREVIIEVTRKGRVEPTIYLDDSL